MVHLPVEVIEETRGGTERRWQLAEVIDDAVLEDGVLLGWRQLLDLRSSPHLASHGVILVLGSDAPDGDATEPPDNTRCPSRAEKKWIDTDQA